MYCEHGALQRLGNFEFSEIVRLALVKDAYRPVDNNNVAVLQRMESISQAGTAIAAEPVVDRSCLLGPKFCKKLIIILQPCSTGESLV